MDFEKLALDYHEFPRPGKLNVEGSKPLKSQYDLSLAYTPGVAGPCREIQKNSEDSFRYTIRSNLVGVITNGSAVLGLGSIGPYAAKPVMEGKGVLFKKFADIDVFDLELDAKDPDRFVDIVSSLEPTFGGINLEDIKAPECFYIEEKLRKKMKIPVFHDDQHGTAIIVAAALINACEISKRSLKDAKVVFSGAGAAAIGCASLLQTMGVKSLILTDRKGVINKERKDLNEYKKRFAVADIKGGLEEALVGADVFIGVSSADILKPYMLKKMAKDPIVFALSNPNPEINPKLALETRSDVIIATGRSDYPNQVNNLLGFPYIFRGALDVRASAVNNEMKLAAVYAIASLAKESVPEEVLAVYKETDRYVFGKDYLIPKPVDQRVLLRVAPAVAKAAMDTGVARVKINLEEYKDRVSKILDPTRRLIRGIRKEIFNFVSQGKVKKPRVVLPYGSHPKFLRAAKQVSDDGEIQICLLGEKLKIESLATKIGIKSLGNISIVDPSIDINREKYVTFLHKKRERKGVSMSMSHSMIENPDYYASCMLSTGDVDALVTGVTAPYVSSVKPILEVVGAKQIGSLAGAGVYIIVKDQKLYFFSDCTININPSPKELAEIAVLTANLAKEYTNDPIRVAMLSYASFGSSKHEYANSVKEATKIIRGKKPEFEVDGEMQADVALSESLRANEFPFAKIKGNANVLIFPNLSSANISYKLLQHIGGAYVTGPILAGINRPANVLQRGASVQEIVNMVYISAHQSTKGIQVKGDEV